MTWLERMNKVLDRIEEGLDDQIDMQELASIASYSLVNLQRVFSIIADMPLSEYIRRRRLTMAAFELQHSDIKIIDVALKYGYDSPEAFARAFSALHGTTPSSARTEGVTLRAYPRISFLLTLKGAVPMDYRIETRDAFRVYGIEGVFSTENDAHLRDVPLFWQDLLSDGRYEQLRLSTHMPDAGEGELCPLNAICDYEMLGNGRFPYMVFAFETDVSEAEGYKTVEVPPATWAIFTSGQHKIEDTSTVMQQLIKRVYTDWLPTASYDKVDGCELELYYGDGDRCRCETWVRVAAK